MRILNFKDILDCAEGSGLRFAVRMALEQSSQKKTSRIARTVVEVGSQKKLGFMPGFSTSSGLYGYKVVSVFSDNPKQGLNPHQGLVGLFNGLDGRVEALLEGSTLTAIRTAAVSAAATDLLSLPEASIMAVFGTGRQAFEHIVSILEVRDLKVIRIFGRSAQAARKLAQAVEAKTSFRCVVVETPREALKGAHIVVTCTSSREPFLDVDDLEPGMHLNAIGASRPGSRELNLRNRPGLRVFVDSMESCREESSEINEDLHVVGEIGKCFLKEIPARLSPKDITLFKSVGLGITDVFVAEYILARSRELKIGTEVEFGR